MAKKSGLGKGINALLGDFEEEKINQPLNTGVVKININKISPNKQQPRKFFDNNQLEELAQSIKNFGIIQPIVVSSNNNDTYTIVAGERRWRASRIAGLKYIPVIIQNYSDVEILQIALIENVQRQDLNPIEEALCYKKLCDEFFFNSNDIAEKVGKPKSSISTSMSLLKLSQNVQALIIENSLQVSHAKLLLAVDDLDLQFYLADKISNEQLNVPQSQLLIKNALENTNKKSDIVNNNKAIFKTFEQELLEIFETKVSIKDKNNKGKIEISYKNHDQLDNILLLLKTLKG